MAARQMGETITRPAPASAAQHSSQQEPATDEPRDGHDSVNIHSFNHQRKLSSIGTPQRGLSSAPNFPTTNTNLATSARNPNTRPRSFHSPTHQTTALAYASPGESYFVPQPTSSGSEARSPANKRPPASRSSHGIETSTGPPPALSTQRTLSTEGSWKFPLAEDLRQSYSQLTPKASASPAAARNLRRGGRNGGTQTGHVIEAGQHNPDPNISPTQSSQSSGDLATKPATTTSAPVGNQNLFSDSGRSHPPDSKDIDIGKMSAQLEGVRRRNTIQEELQSQSSQEDFFLNLAHTDGSPTETAAPASREERRRSRTAQAIHRPSLSQGTIQASERRPQSSGASYESAQYSLLLPERQSSIQRQDQPSYLKTPSSAGRPIYSHRSYAASAHPLDNHHQSRLYGGTSKHLGNSSRDIPGHEASPELPSYGRRPSVPESSLGVPTRAYRQSNLSHATNGHYHSSPLTARSHMYEEDSPPTPRAEGTESTVSTTAPSTIFDELDDLKSRLKKLELTARMPTSSGAAISGATVERPPTATTTITTLSSSPNRGRDISISPGDSVPNNPMDGSSHPLLHAALQKLKPLVSLQVHRALDAAASDALAMVQMTTSGTAGGNPGGSDRRLKRKADSLCRSLTELCIALSEDKPNVESGTSKLRSSSRDTAVSRAQREGSVEQQRTQRSMSHDPEESTSSRVLSRLEARRTSMLGLNGTTHRSSVPSDSQAQATTPMQGASSSSSGLDRTSTVLQRARRVIDDDNDRTVRPMSRATTELGLKRPPFRQTGSSKDYISSSSNRDTRTPTLQSSLPVPRNYLLSTSQLPSTPSAQLGTQRYLERATSNSADNARLVEARQRRLASMGQYNLAVRQGADSVGRKLRRPSVDRFGVDGQGVD